MMKIKDVLQDLKRYLIEFDSNVIGIKKIDNKIIFEVENGSEKLSGKSFSKQSKEIE